MAWISRTYGFPCATRLRSWEALAAVMVAGAVFRLQELRQYDAVLCSVRRYFSLRYSLPQDVVQYECTKYGCSVGHQGYGGWTIVDLIGM